MGAYGGIGGKNGLHGHIGGKNGLHGHTGQAQGLGPVPGTIGQEPWAQDRVPRGPGTLNQGLGPGTISQGPRAGTSFKAELMAGGHGHLAWGPGPDLFGVASYRRGPFIWRGRPLFCGPGPANFPIV